MGKVEGDKEKLFTLMTPLPWGKSDDADTVADDSPVCRSG